MLLKLMGALANSKSILRLLSVTRNENDVIIHHRSHGVNFSSRFTYPTRRICSD